MKLAYLFYERQDARINATFIEQLQEAARRHDILLELVYPEQLQELSTEIQFVWNRSRQAQIAQYFEALHIRVFNNALTNTYANNKLKAIRFVEQLQIKTVPTFNEASDITSFPIVVKSLDGHGGKEVVLCHTQEALQQAILSFAPKPVIFQPYIASFSQDVRVWMLGDTVLGAVLRTGHNDFKSNFTLGGSIERFILPPTLTTAVNMITTSLQSDYIGIDFIRAEDGTFYFNELEDPVGAKSYYELYDHTLPQQLIRYIAQQLQ